MRKVIFWVCLFAFLPFLAMGLGTLVPRPFSLSVSAEGESDGETQASQILVLSNPIHTDIALPATPDVLEAMSFVSKSGLELDYPGVHWIIVGWGSRSFFIETPTWADLKPGPVFDALTWDRSVMHVQRAGTISLEQDTVIALDLEQADFDSLLANIVSSFERSNGPEPLPIAGAAYGPHDAFFPAIGGFNAFMGCNTWTARMLRRAGVTTGLWTPLPINLRWSLSLHNSQ